MRKGTPPADGRYLLRLSEHFGNQTEIVRRLQHPDRLIGYAGSGVAPAPAGRTDANNVQT